MAKWTECNVEPQDGRTVIVTGANTGIGFETARVLVQAGAHCIMACRSQTKAEEAMRRIFSQAPGREKNMEFIHLDLLDMSSIHTFCTEFSGRHKKLHLLINNAGFMRVAYSHTGNKNSEVQFFINHLGHFALTGLLLSRLRAAEKEDARIVNVASLAHTRGNIDFNAILKNKGMEYNHELAYSNSKLANLLFTYELQRRLDAAGIPLRSLAAHPGLAATSIAEHMKVNVWKNLVVSLIMKIVAQSAKRGALPTLRAALDNLAKPGSYYGPSGRNEFRGYPVQVQSNERSHNLENAQKLWEISEEITGVQFNFK